ncbi:MAG: preprotein translocase subunit SecG [Candidatus Onthovivens sp.]|nr:preprotein translocase subunit SecG [Candidatus Onthovivens sp.]
MNTEEEVMQWYDYVFWVIAFIIIVLGLLQGGKSEGASGAITGGGLNVFVKTKERGSELIISYLTLGFGIVFLFFALLSTSLTQAASTEDTTETALRVINTISELL